MAEFSKLIITGSGQALIAKMIAGTGNIEFTKVSTSSAVYEQDQLEGLAALSDIEQTSLISSIIRTNGTAVKIETAFNNMELTAGYYMRTLGLYANDPDDGEILYAVTTETSGNCYIPPYNGVTVSGAYIKLITTVGNAENVSLEVDLAAAATIGNLKDLEKNLDTVEIKFEDGDEGEDTERVNIQSNDSLGTIFRKVKRWLADLKSAAFCYVANNCLTTGQGGVLDARQGKYLHDEIKKLKQENSEINSNIENLGKSVADGKKTVADAISAMGVTTATDADFETLAKNVGKISTGGALQVIGQGRSSPGGDYSGTYTFPKNYKFAAFIMVAGNNGKNSGSVWSNAGNSIPINNVISGNDECRLKTTCLLITNPKAGNTVSFNGFCESYSYVVIGY